MGKSRMTALKKPNGGVRGIVAGDALRRLIARNHSAANCQKQWNRPAIPICFVHQGGLRMCGPQAMTDIDPEATITSINGMSAFDLISRRAMLEELSPVPGGREVLPFVLMFYGTPSSYMWEDGTDTVHRIAQGEGGEQGDPLMPLLYALGQHQACFSRRRAQGHQSCGSWSCVHTDAGGVVSSCRHSNPWEQNQGVEPIRCVPGGVRHVAKNCNCG